MLQGPPSRESAIRDRGIGSAAGGSRRRLSKSSSGSPSTSRRERAKGNLQVEVSGVKEAGPRPRYLALGLDIFRGLGIGCHLTH